MRTRSQLISTDLSLYIMFAGKMEPAETVLSIGRASATLNPEIGATGAVFDYDEVPVNTSAEPSLAVF